jgi:hypothetical protein
MGASPGDRAFQAALAPYNYGENSKSIDLQLDGCRFWGIVWPTQ